MPRDYSPDTMKGKAIGAISLFCMAALLGGGNSEAEETLVDRGRYVFSLAGGCACHTIPDETPHLGGRSFPVPLGEVYSTNITNDKKTGLGNWTDEQIHDSMVKGVRPNGETIIPVMPYEAYSGMAQEDMKALIAYLRTLQPVRKETLQAEFMVPFVRALSIPMWLKLFGRFSKAPEKAPESGIERGRYLVEHVSLCGDCHTPRNFLGVPNGKLYLAGAQNGPLGETVPNVTPDADTGIGKWTREEIAELLLTGTKPNFDDVQGLMAEVIEGTPLGYKEMRQQDALAIADYLKSIPPIENKIEEDNG